MNNPKPNAVPDTIRSSTGPSGATSNGIAGVDADIPIQREKKLLLVAVEFVVEVRRDGKD